MPPTKVCTSAQRQLTPPVDWLPDVVLRPVLVRPRPSKENGYHHTYVWVESGDSERVLKLRQRNSIDAAKSLYQLMRFDARTKAPSVHAVSGG